MSRWINIQAISLRLLIATIVCSPSFVQAAEDDSFLSDTAFQTSFEDSHVQPCASCDSGTCGRSDSKLFGLFAKSDHCFDAFISPMTNPVFFEDPRTLTEARVIYLHHRLPGAVGGGEVDLGAVQIRAALTERLSIVAAKDGYATSSSPLIRDGWADVSVGLKYNLHADPVKQRLLSAGFAYEIPVGTPRTWQGNGDGVFHIYMTGGAEFMDYGHWISASGFRLPSDPSAKSSVWYWSNHFDYEIFDGWYALTEVNWFNYIGAGTGGIAGVEGGDLFNLGSTGVAGNDIVTQAVGFKYKRNKNREIGVAFEFPLTTRRDVFENRLTVDWIFRY